MSDEEGHGEISPETVGLKAAHTGLGVAEVLGHMGHHTGKVLPGLGLAMGALGFGLEVNEGHDPFAAALCTMQEMLPLVGILPFASGCGVEAEVPEEPHADDMSYLCPEGQTITSMGCFDPQTETFATPYDRLLEAQQQGE